MRRYFAIFAAMILLWTQPAYAQSILRDAETEALFRDMSRPMIVAAGLSPANVQVVLIQDDEINAFVAGGQTIYIQSGLIQAADNANQVQGVIAHELGHIADGHVVLADAGYKPAIGISLLSMVLGLAAVAAGAGEAGAGIFAAGQQAAMGKALAFTRVQEATADATGAKFLREAGISGKGMIQFFKKLANEEYRYGLANIDPFAQTHPLSNERVNTLSADLKASPAWDKPFDPDLEERFRRVKAKLEGYAYPYGRTLTDYPESDTSIYGHYARAYAWHKAGYPAKADAETLALIKAMPHDPYFLEIRGQILLEAGRPADAIAPLKEASELTRYDPLIVTTYGHALIATEDPANYPEAERVLRIAVNKDSDNPFAWLQLGTVYELRGDTARAALATAETASSMGDIKRAVYSARAAMAGLPPNTPDWIRAQDIALTGQNQLDDKKRKK
ncbi:M48 family metalloprotease [Sphingomonas sp.]|jgi:predicted Zn-dependent protease|uniref:M48 family metalloprotease n=1 Tax=Sphingomonas sp. TaxID=28214 RepID=UPI002E316CD3|nr:M48 family metalloprotease [Sphingomonas sp.]HEX4695573.1 M48 family metalloprotease [Sphingomonas sp.]